jgi:hypothetical protein
VDIGIAQSFFFRTFIFSDDSLVVPANSSRSTISDSYGIAVFLKIPNLIMPKSNTPKAQVTISIQESGRPDKISTKTSNQKYTMLKITASMYDRNFKLYFLQISQSRPGFWQEMSGFESVKF